jgi:hypothetical protein
MNKPKSNLFDYLFPKKRKPQTMEISTSDYNKLMSAINSVADAYKSSQAENAALRSANRSLTSRVKDLEDEAAADEIKKSEGIAILEGLLDAGGSTGGVVG